MSNFLEVHESKILPLIQSVAREEGYFLADEEGTGNYVSPMQNFSLITAPQKWGRVSYFIFFSQLTRPLNKMWLKVLDEGYEIVFEVYGGKDRLEDAQNLAKIVQQKHPRIKISVEHKSFISKEEEEDDDSDFYD